jgi:NSS family neurotransmitter:Na+ symporter
VLGQNGGGAFLIPYLVSILALATPLMILELASGRSRRGSVIQAFSSVHPRLSTLGWLINTIVFCILSYYLVITGWTLAFFVFALSGTNTTFAEFTGGLKPIAFFLVTATVAGAVVAMGVRTGIERLSSVVMPAAAIILLVLALYTVTLSGFGEAVRYLFRPRFGVLDDPYIWSAAIGQAFFSLSVGFGVLLAYGAYLGRNTNIATSAAIIAFADLAVAITAGLVIFPIVFTYNLEPTAGSQLAFETLPAAFDVMSGGTLLGIAFFAVLFLAALTSAVSMLEANVAAVMEATKLGRRAVTLALTGLVILIGLPSALSYSSVKWTVAGARVLDLMDDTLGTLGLPLAGLLIAIVMTWWTTDDVLASELEGALGRWMVRVLRILVRYIVPPVLITILVARLAYADGFEGWHILPASGALSRIERDVAVAVMLPLLLGATLGVVSMLRSRIVRHALSPDSDRPASADLAPASTDGPEA